MENATHFQVNPVNLKLLNFAQSIQSSSFNNTWSKKVEANKPELLGLSKTSSQKNKAKSNFQMNQDVQNQARIRHLIQQLQVLVTSRSGNLTNVAANSSSNNSSSVSEQRIEIVSDSPPINNSMYNSKSENGNLTSNFFF